MAKNKEIFYEEEQIIARRNFLKISGAGLSLMALGSLGNFACDNSSGRGDGAKDAGSNGGKDAGEDAGNNSGEKTGGLHQGRYFYFAALADTHIIDDFYKGREGNELDTETIYKTSERFIKARDAINKISPAVSMAFIAGDFVHNYPSTDWDFYFENKTRFDNAKEIASGFKMPFHFCLGNHDYDIGKISREFTQELFREKFGLERTYYSVEREGWKFILLDNYLGETHDTSSSRYPTQNGSLGRTQLDWLEAELAEGKPSFIFLHHPMPLIDAREYGRLGMGTLLKEHEEDIQAVISGHWHRWQDFKNLYGPQHYAISSTRYDEDAFWIIEVDVKQGSYRIVNRECVEEWGAYKTAPYETCI